MAIRVFAWPRDYYTAVGTGPNDLCRWPAAVFEPSEGDFHPGASEEFRQSLKRDRKWQIQGQIMAAAK